MDRLTKLRRLEQVLEKSLCECEVDKLASLARQYRETLREIDEIEGQKGNNDGISEILQRRSSNGLPGSVRKDKS